MLKRSLFRYEGFNEELLENVRLCTFRKIELFRHTVLENELFVGSRIF